MAKLFNDSGNTNANANAGLPGIFIETGKIISMSVNSNNARNNDVDFKIELEFTKKKSDDTYTKTFFLSGNMFRDKSLPPHLTHFLLAVGIESTPNKDTIIEDFAQNIDSMTLLDLVIGKEIQVLSFVSGTYGNEGKPSYKFWNGMQDGFKSLVNCYDVNTPKIHILTAFQKRLDGKYPPPYTPQVLTANVNKNEEQSEEQSESTVNY